MVNPNVTAILKGTGSHRLLLATGSQVAKALRRSAEDTPQQSTPTSSSQEPRDASSALVTTVLPKSPYRTQLKPLQAGEGTGGGGGCNGSSWARSFGPQGAHHCLLAGSLS